MKNYTGFDRYQFQPRHIKAARWLWHMPRVPFEFAYCVLWWACRGFSMGNNPFGETRRQVLGVYWSIAISHAQIRMGRYSTLEEFRNELMKGPTP